jgi:hypothetical protein
MTQVPSTDGPPLRRALAKNCARASPAGQASPHLHASCADQPLRRPEVTDMVDLPDPAPGSGQQLLRQQAGPGHRQARRSRRDVRQLARGPSGRRAAVDVTAPRLRLRRGLRRGRRTGTDGRHGRSAPTSSAPHCALSSPRSTGPSGKEADAPPPQAGDSSSRPPNHPLPRLTTPRPASAPACRGLTRPPMHKGGWPPALPGLRTPLPSSGQLRSDRAPHSGASGRPPPGRPPWVGSAPGSAHGRATMTDATKTLAIVVIVR